MLTPIWLFATLWTVARQASLSMGFPGQEYWSGLPFPSPGDLPDPGIELTSPALKVDSLPAESLESQMISTELVQSRVPRLQAEGDMRMFSSWETWRQGEKQKGHRPVSRAHRCCPSWPHWSQSSGFHAFLSLLNDPSSGFPRHWIPPHPSKKNKQPIKNRVIFGKCGIQPFFRRHTVWSKLLRLLGETPKYVGAQLWGSQSGRAAVMRGDLHPAATPHMAASLQPLVWLHLCDREAKNTCQDGDTDWRYLPSLESCTPCIRKWA